MTSEKRPGIYEFTDEASDIADIYEFSADFPVALDSDDYQFYFSERAGENRIENLAQLWLEAEEKVELRLDVLEDYDDPEELSLFVNSSLGMIKEFYNTSNRFLEAEERFEDAADDDFEDYKLISDALEEELKDNSEINTSKEPTETIEKTLERIEKFRDSYLESEQYDFLRGY